MMKKTSPVLLLLLLLSVFTHAQNWMQDMHDPNVNFFTVQREFNAWWAANGQQILSAPIGEEGENAEVWKLYKRWEQDMMPSMVESNGVRLGAFNQDEWNFYKQRRAHQNQRSAANWSYIGTSMSFLDGGTDSVTGRVNCVRFDPVNPRIIYCGAPSGGLWKSVDFGISWQMLNTDNLPQIGVSDVVINPLNTQTLYIATGDIANSACLSVGVLKSLDGGQTWDTTGLIYTTTQGRLIGRLMMSPLDTNTLYAATNTGVLKTTNGGQTWRTAYAVTGLTSMDFNPLNSNTIYAWGTQLYRSVDSGGTWKKLSAGLPAATSVGGFGVGLTPADTACIYVMVSDSTIPTYADMPYKGFYRSLNAGDTFTRQCARPDQTGTQGTYDLTMGVSPTNKNVIVMGAVNMVVSTDGGVTWHAPSLPTHVDHHDIRFFHNSPDTVFSANDGGLFISTDSGTTWKSLNNGMHIGQVYHVSSGPISRYLYLSGRQDEGTLLQDTTSAKVVSTGDGLQCQIDPLNESHLIGSLEQGLLGYSYNYGQSITILVNNFTTGVNGPGAWSTPFVLQRGSSNIIYVAKDKVYRTNNGGNSWATLHSPTLPSNDNLYQWLLVAPSDSNYIYAATVYKLYRSKDGGNTFTSITTGLSGKINSLAVSESNPLEIWVGESGSGILLKSIDGGSHYTSFNTGLPSGPFYPKWIAPVRNSKDALYTSLGNAGGVYYRDSTMSAWGPFSSGLPNVTVDHIEIDYCAGKVRAATYGRDIWETDPYQPLNVPPIANATFASSAGACTDTVSFTDRSDFVPTSWQWSFPGGQPASSAAQNPVVIYPGSQTYMATLVASNAYGADTVQYSIQTNFCVGVNQLSDNNQIQVYPNPNNGNFKISLTGDVRGKIDMALMNNIGQVVTQSSYNKQAGVMTADFSISALAKGVYYLRITSEGGEAVQKLVVE